MWHNTAHGTTAQQQAEIRLVSLKPTSGLASFPQVFFFIFSGGKPLGMSGTDFLWPDILAVTQQWLESTERNTKQSSVSGLLGPIYKKI